MNHNLQIVCPHCRSINRVPAARLTDRPHCGQCHAPLFTGHPIGLTARDFDLHVSRADVPLVVDFWAPWCGPCRMMAPAYEEAAKVLEPHVRLAKVNTEEEQALAAPLRHHQYSDAYGVSRRTGSRPPAGRDETSGHRTVGSRSDRVGTEKNEHNEHMEMERPGHAATII